MTPFTGSISPTTKAALAITVLGLGPALILFGMGHIYWPVYLSLITIVALVGLVTGLAIWGIKDRLKLRGTLQNVWMSILALVIVLFALEAFCRVFVAWSDGFVVTLSEKNWLRRNWQPINSLGYRDAEPTEETLAGRTRILVIGDSTSAGAGLENIEDRYQNNLARMLGDRYAVMTAAEIGWDSKEELAALQNYPYTPDIVILTYSVNDIDHIAAAHGVKPKPGFSLNGTPLFPLISTSYFLNFAYYSVLRLPIWGSNDAARVYQKQAYADPAVWEEHTQTLKAFEAWAQEHDAQLVVMVYPDINAPEITSPFSKQVADYFDGLGDVSTLDLGPALSGRDPRDMSVSALDAHPNPATQRLVAGLLCQIIAGLKNAPPVSCPQSP